MPRTAARWPICRTPLFRPGWRPPCWRSRTSASTARAASSISMTAPSNSRSSSTLGSGCSATRSAKRSQRRRPAGSSRRGRRSCPTRESCRCCGRCFRNIPTCCRPISRTIRRRPRSARPSCASRYIRARVPMSRWSAPAPRWRAGRPLWRGGIHPAGLCAAAELRRAVSRARKLGGRPCAVRAVDPRGREPDHRQHVPLPAARDRVAGLTRTTARYV